MSCDFSECVRLIAKSVNICNYSMSDTPIVDPDGTARAMENRNYMHRSALYAMILQDKDPLTTISLSPLHGTRLLMKHIGICMSNGRSHLMVRGDKYHIVDHNTTECHRPINASSDKFLIALFIYGCPDPISPYIPRDILEQEIGTERMNEIMVENSRFADISDVETGPPRRYRRAVMEIKMLDIIRKVLEIYPLE